ncbi:MAG: hypothetical protein LBP25_02380 [Tannerellaceae bacterium]|jgi:hypothetical protein|nr:hypothetical protein [Tannerellaceae bacterium]
MKTAIQSLALCIGLLCTFTLSAQQKDIPKEMLGKWTYTYEDPQSGQSSVGTCTLTQDGATVKATFELDYGTIVTTALRPNENGKYYADMEVQSYPLSVAFKPNGETLQCDILADSFDFTVQMKRAE